MPAPTVAVSVRLYGSDGAAQSGVLVTARLDKADEYGGFIVSDPVTGTTDADGLVVLDLFPNDPVDGLGTTGSVYTISATPPGAKRWSVQAQIPNTDCDLDDVATTEVAATTDVAFPVAVRRATLTGLSTASSADVSASDTVLSAFGKLQAKFTALAASAGAAMVGFIHSATGSVARTVQARLRDLPPSVKDLNATGDNTADDLAAFTAARNSVPAGQAGDVFVPRAAYYLSGSMQGVNGNLVRWRFADGAYTTSSAGGAAAWGRVSGTTYWKEYRTSQAQRVDIAATVDSAQGNAIREYETIVNNGPDTGHGNRRSYVSSAYGASSFDIGETRLARWVRSDGDGRSGQQMAQWIVAQSPTLSSSYNGTCGTFCAEWNVVNCAEDHGWQSKRSATDTFSGVHQIVPETERLFGVAGIGKNVLYGTVYCNAPENNAYGYRPRLYNPILGEPNSVHETGRAIYWSGSDGTGGTGGGAPVALVEADDAWQWIVKTNKATTSREAIGLGSTHVVGWLDASDVLLNGDYAGSGSPEGVLAAPVGSTYRRRDGGAGTCFYVKESGTGNTGWVAK